MSAVVVVVAIAIGCASRPVYSDIEIDLSALQILPLPAAAAPAAVTAEEALARVERDHGAIRVVRLGRRWTPANGSVWVIVFRPEVGGGCEDCWVGWTMSDQAGRAIAVFDAGSLRAFGVDLPDW